MLSGAAQDGGPACVRWESAAITQSALSAPGTAGIPDAAAELCAGHCCVSRTDLAGGRSVGSWQYERLVCTQCHRSRNDSLISIIADNCERT